MTHGAMFATDDTHETDRWVVGEHFGLQIPADEPALVAGGPEFLTEAFIAFGAMSSQNRVTSIVGSVEFFGGGTGKKFLMTVDYAIPEPGLPQQLFVKFSRNFDDELWDRARFVSISEVNFAVLSRDPGFPVPIPLTLFADINLESASGLIISECLNFGENGIEPHYLKCMDLEVPDQLGHYQAIMRGLGSLAGASRSGKLPAAFLERFPYNQGEAMVPRKAEVSEEKIFERATRLFDFIALFPQLFPANVRTEEFREAFFADIPEVLLARPKLRQLLQMNPDFVAFSHWNANIDNCWFFRDQDGILTAGFVDWANAGQMSVAQTIQGSISGAEPELWNNHLDDILTTFIDQYSLSGGPKLEIDEVRRNILLSTAVNFDWSMGAPIAISRAFADPSDLVSSQDPRFLDHENARIQLHMTTHMLNTWQTRKLGDLVKSVYSTLE